MTSEDNKARTGHMREPALRVLKARWEFPSEGPDDPKRRLLIDLAFRLAATMQPSFAPSRTLQPISSRFEVDEMTGGTFQEEVSRLGDTEHGVEITDRFYNPNDGIVGISGWTAIRVYGLPEGWDIYLDGDFVAAQYGRPQPMSLRATMPEETINAVANILTAEFGATVERGID
jgi:hypothetical protein